MNWAKWSRLGVALVGLAMSADSYGQDAKQQAVSQPVFQAPRVALDKGATACVGLLQDALRLTVEGDHQELSSWHPTETRSRTFWTAQVDRAGSRGAFVSVTPTDSARCDAQTVRASFLKQDCKAAVAELGKGGSSPVSMFTATVVQRDATGRLAMFLPAGTGCVFLEVAVLYGK